MDAREVRAPQPLLVLENRRHAAEGRALLHGGRNGKRRRHKWKIGPTMGQDFRFLVGGLVIAGVTLTLLHFLTPII